MYVQNFVIDHLSKNVPHPQIYEGEAGRTSLLVSRIQFPIMNIEPHGVPIFIENLIMGCLV